MGNNCCFTRLQEIDIKDDITQSYDIECVSIKDGCACVNRIVSALRYYSSLDQNHKHAKNELIKYCSVTYKSLLDDYVHIVTNHNNGTDLNEILNVMNHSECRIINCTSASRHYRDRNMNIIDNDKSETINKDFTFFSDILDSIHCFLFHLYDIGLRVKEDKCNTDDICNEVDAENKYDQRFANMYGKINAKKQNLKKLGVFNHRFQNDKFCVKTTATDDAEEITLIDVLYAYMDEKLASDEECEKLKSMVNDEEYDSEAIVGDVDDHTNSNIRQLMRDISFHYIETFMRQTKLSDDSFSIGYVFYYWPYYEKEILAPEKRETPGEINDHSGYEPKELYVKSKYKNIKHELLNNKLHSLSLDEFEISNSKSNKYINALITKTIKAGNAGWLHYNIMAGACISFSHLLAIIMYCDWSELSQEFSTTFRKTRSFETITEVKARNREYANWSKALREAVQIFGQKGWIHAFEDEKTNNEWNSKNNRVRGPFFCGMSTVMIIPEFNIRLCGPTSTSRHIEVATRFAGEKGIIIQLNNNGDYYATDLRSFNCSWVSNYAGEDEQLFIGGDRRIKIESIINIVTKENFENFFQALFYFHCMINGSRMEDHEPKITNADYTMLNYLIQCMLGTHDSTKQYPQYIIDTFTAFTNYTKQIVVNLYQINKYFNELKSLIIYDDQSQRRNMFKEILFQLFKNVNHIIIYSTSLGFSNNDEYKEYPLELLLLLNTICSSDKFISKNFQITIKATHDFSKATVRKSWIFEAVSDYVKSKFKEKKLNLELTQTFGASNKNEDWLIIAF
eukprot:371456_1